MGTVKYRVTINLLTPFNISSGQEKGGQAQKRTVLYKGKPYIPGSTIKGKIRWNFYRITELSHSENNCNCAMCALFGGQGYKPSKVYVDDFLPVDGENSGNKALAVRYGIAINRYTKTVADEHLYSQEVATGGKFSGYITVYFDNETVKYKRNLEMAIKMVENVGGGHSKGYGRALVQLEEV